MKSLWFVIVALFFTAWSVRAAESVDFQTVWSAVKKEHPELRSAVEEFEAAKELSSLGSRHWLPSVYFSGRAYNTNDPTYQFMGILGQRSVGAADFSPSALNYPANQNFTQLGLGLNLPLFEGGFSSAFSELQDSNLNSKDHSRSATEISVYTTMVSSYAGALNSELSLIALQDLKTKVKSVLNRYLLGSKSNPVGYSGLLGLKSILNRVDASILHIEAEKKSQVNEMISRSESFRNGMELKKQEINPFLEEVLPASALKDEEVSHQIVSAENGAQMAKSKVAMERARYLPQVGLFTEGNVTSGSRNTASSYIGGLYLKWSLFNPKDFGMAGEAFHSSEAAEAKLKNARTLEKNAKKQLNEFWSAILENSKILKSSTELMDEQVLTATRLFQSGSINALQLVEVFNRRADLILQVKDLNQNHIEVRTQLAKASRLKGVLR